MAEFSIESNGRIEKTAVYYNGEQMGGIKEVFINIDESGAFDAVVQYTGSDGALYTKQIFSDYFEKLQTMEPSFDEEEAQSMRLLTLASDGNLESTIVAINDEEQGGIVSLLVHIKAPNHTSGGIRAFFGGREDIPERPSFKAEITYREEDGTLTTEGVF